MIKLKNYIKLEKNQLVQVNQFHNWIGVGIDFATAEALAFGTLLEEGYSVRLSG